VVLCAKKCSADKKHFDTGVKLSRTYLHEGKYEAAFSLCDKLLESLQSSGTGDDDSVLSLSRVIASAFSACPPVYADHRQTLVSFFYPVKASRFQNFLFVDISE